ncbi:hypothetical protein B0H14DRAFT_2690496 [Mycena olivaceomarginata]|nr:hypothetical protein B0H14DRAFT_2690496 [Mycena olivaceomarginata]
MNYVVHSTLMLSQSTSLVMECRLPTFTLEHSSSQEGRTFSPSFKRPSSCLRFANSVVPCSSAMHSRSYAIWVCSYLSRPRWKKLLFSGAAHGGLWHIVRPIVAPPRGIREKVRKVAGTVKERESARTDVVLNTIGEIHGTTCRDSLVLDMLHSFHAKYALSPEEWVVVVLNAYSVGCFNLTPVLAATDWSLILPLLDLPSLRKLTMGLETVYTAQPELHDIGTAELDAFLTCHKNVERLEYLPQLSPHNTSESLGFSLASLQHLMHLTTTPAHFLHLHHAQGPNSFPMTLVNLILFAPASTPVARTAAEFMVLLRLLGDNTQVEAPGVRLRFPGAWIALAPPPPVGLEIQCVTSLVAVGDFARDADALAEFLSPFEPGLRWVKFQPITRCTLEHMHIVDELRRKLPWVEAWEETRPGSHQKEGGKEGV